jgi:hypothetical protein
LLGLTLAFTFSSIAQERPLFLDKTSRFNVAKDQTLLEASFGLPNIASGPLNSESFVPMPTRRLKNAEVVWANLELLREMGIKVPKGGLTAEFQEEMLNAWAWVAKANIPDSEFLPGEKILYADLYGGSGGDAQGSGRAAAAGFFQCKGCGRTPLAGPLPGMTLKSAFSFNPIKLYNNLKDYFSEIHHSHGGATLREGMGEAIWGEILNRDLPFGGNRVVAVIATDLKIGALNERRTLIIRENSVRPAHFIRVAARMEKDPEAEKERIQKLTRSLLKSLTTYGEQNGSQEEMFIDGQIKIISRIAQKYATEYTHGYFHGSTSPSNIEIDGRAVDHGPMTALDGYPKALFADMAPNGSIKQLEHELLFELFRDMRKAADESIKHDVFSDSQVHEILKREFDARVAQEFIILTGAPPVIIDDLMTKEPVKSYARLLRSLAEKGNRQIVDVRYRIPINTGAYDIHEILPILAATNPEQRALNLALFNAIPDKNVRLKLIDAHLKYMAELERSAGRRGLNAEGIRRYIKIAAERWNKKLPELYRGPNQWAGFYKEIAKFSYFRSKTAIRQFIDNAIDRSFRMVRDNRTFEIITNRLLNRDQGTLQEKVYDPATDAERTQTRQVVDSLANGFPEETKQISNGPTGAAISCSAVFAM